MEKKSRQEWDVELDSVMDQFFRLDTEDIRDVKW